MTKRPRQRLQELPTDVSFYYCGVDVVYDFDERKITNEKVSSVELSKVFKKVEEIYSDYVGSVSAIESYCIDRIIRSLEMYNPGNYTIDTWAAYYGDEVKSVDFIHITELMSRLARLSKLSTNREKMEYILILEYGYLLDVLKDCYWEIRQIKRSDVIQCQDAYIKKVPFCDFYRNWNLPLCVVTPGSQNGYRLIDGYHRFTNNPDLQEISVICASK